MPWEVARADEVIAHSGADEFKDDEIEFVMSVGGGPMYLEWRTKTLQPKINLQAFTKYAITFRITSDPIYSDVEQVCLLESIRNENDYFVYRFVPKARSFASKYRFTAMGGVKRVGDLEKVFKKELGIEEFICPNEVAKMRLFDGFAVDGSIMQFVADLCYRILSEYTVDDRSVVIGKVETDFDDEYEIQVTNNNLIVSNIYGVDVSLIMSPYQPRPLGSKIRYKGILGRLFAFKYEYGPDKERTHFYVADPEIHISDFHLSLLFGNGVYKGNTYPVDTGIITGFTKEGIPLARFNSRFFDPKIKIEGIKGGINVTRMHTYADKNGYGELFPNHSGNAVFLFDKNFRGAGIYAGDIFPEESKIPERTDTDDYRLTLPGATVYISKGGVYIISANSKIMIAGNTDSKYDTVGIDLAQNTLPAARQDDPTISNNSTDPAYWNWMQMFKTALTSWTPVPSDGGAALKAILSASVTPNWPTEQKGKIEQGSSNVEVN